VRPRALFLLLGVALAVGLSACGGGSGSSSTSGTTTEGSSPFSSTDEATTSASTTAAGDPTAGKEVFAANGCGACHALRAAESSGTVGPDLNQRLVADAEDAGVPLGEYVRQSITDPGAVVATGYQPGVMPANFVDSLSLEQMDDLVAFVTQSVQ
jgi:mono/diheme cytochrome c family protein